MSHDESCRAQRMPPGHSGFARRDGAVPVPDRQAVELLASALARLEAVTAWLDTRPPVDEKERPVAGRGRGALAPTDPDEFNCRVDAGLVPVLGAAQD